MPRESKQKDIYLIAQNIRSLFNVGALFRCADVFGVKKVYLCGYTGFPPRKEISKVALGAEKWIPWEKYWQTHVLIKKLRSEGVCVVALETGKKSISLPNYKPSFPMALIVGSETNGISKKILEMVDSRVSIPMFGKKESLNVAVAAGIALCQLRNRRK